MLARLAGHVRHNIVAYLALFVALGGTSYAATTLPKHSVGTKQLKNASVSNTKLQDRSVSGSDVKRNTLTGNNINASTLGTVPSANNANDLAGSPASAYVKAPLPAVRATNSSNETVNGSKDLTFNTNVYDNSGMHNTTTDTDQLTAPISGIYEITGDVDWAANATGERELIILKNTSTEVAATQAPVNSGSNDTIQQVTTQVSLNGGDTVVLNAETTSSGGLTVEAAPYSPVFAMHWLGP